MAVSDRDKFLSASEDWMRIRGESWIAFDYRKRTPDESKSGMVGDHYVLRDSENYELAKYLIFTGSRTRVSPREATITSHGGSFRYGTSTR